MNRAASKTFQRVVLVIGHQSNYCFGSSTGKQFKYKFESAVGFAPNPYKQAMGGDDAHFIGSNFMALADQVGGWTEAISDANGFPQKFIGNLQRIQKNEAKKAITEPIYAVKEAIRMMQLPGATTITLLTLDPDSGVLRSYYLGNSIYGFLRQKEIELVEPQMVSYNRPFQIGDTVCAPHEGYQQEYQKAHIDIENDIIALCSDGLWDNLSLERLHYETRGPNSFDNGTKRPKTLEQMAQKVAAIANQYSLSAGYESPFYKRALAEGVRLDKQGKMDDITVILAKIVKEQVSP